MIIAFSDLMKQSLELVIYGCRFRHIIIDCSCLVSILGRSFLVSILFGEIQNPIFHLFINISITNSSVFFQIFFFFCSFLGG